MTQTLHHSITPFAYPLLPIALFFKNNPGKGARHMKTEFPGRARSNTSYAMHRPAFPIE